MAQIKPNWGGTRANAGAKPKWNSGKTIAIRIPEAFAEQLLALARNWDINDHNRLLATNLADKDELVQNLAETVQTLKTDLMNVRLQRLELTARAAEQSVSIDKLTQTNDQLIKYRDVVQQSRADLIVKDKKIYDDRVTISTLITRNTHLEQEIKTTKDKFKNGDPIVAKLEQILIAAAKNGNDANYKIYIQIAQSCLDGADRKQIDLALTAIANANTTDKTANNEYRRQALAAIGQSTKLRQSSHSKHSLSHP